MRPNLNCVVSVSGIRGVVGDTLNVHEILGLAAAYGTVAAHGGPVVLGRDSRPTGTMIAQVVTGALRSVGCQVIDLGVVPTPTVPIMVKQLGAMGGVMISASHNPVEWNALKFFNHEARNIDQHQLDWILNTYRDPPIGMWKRWDHIGGQRNDETALDTHLAKVLAAVDVARIRERAFTVLVDSVNGSGAMLAPRLLQALGCRVIPLHSRIDILFPRDPEPTASNVVETGAVVKAVGADVGFVQDPDADRLAIIDEHGRYIGEEYTLALCGAARLQAAKSAGNPSPLACTNLSTSRMLEDLAARIGGRVLRTKVGEANVVDAMQANQAVVGGEGNGGVIDPRVAFCRDSHIAMALLLELMANSDASLSSQVAEVPTYAMHKEKILLDRAGVAKGIELVKAHSLAQGAELDTRDGLKLSWPDRWVHLRASGTEPASRIISEAPTAAKAMQLAADVRAVLGVEMTLH